MLSNNRLSFATALWLSLAFCVANSLVWAQQPSEALKQTKRTDPRVADSAAAVQLLRHTDEARRTLASGDQTQALAHVNTALMLIEQFNNRTRVPIYAELEQTAFLGPIEVAKRGAKERAAIDPAPVNRTPAVQLTIGEYTRVSLDVAQAHKQLLAARAALNDKQPTQADAALLALQNGVTLEAVTLNHPLLRARQQLALALKHAREGHAQTVTDELKAAADALNNYTLAADAQRVGEVKALRGEIMTYLQQSQPAHAAAADRINAWWNRVADWLDAPAELTQK